MNCKEAMLVFSNLELSLKLSLFKKNWINLTATPNDFSYSLHSGNSPGIQREASLAEKVRRSGARGLSDVSTS